MIAPVLIRRGTAVLLLSLMIALGVYAWRGWYARYVTDDFCTASILHRLGFVEAMKFHREHWSGRYSYYAVKAIPESLGRGTAQVVPALGIALFCAAAIWSVRRVFAARGALAATGGLALVFATIDSTPDVLTIGGPLVWETGFFTYMLPLILFTVWAGLFFNGGRPDSRAWLRVTMSAVLMLFAGGLSETSLAAQGAITAGILGVAIVLRASDAIRVAAAGFAATLVALYLVGSAPGNAVRMSELPEPQPLPSAVLESFRLAYAYIGSNVFIGGAALVVVVTAGILLGGGVSRGRVPALLLVALASLGAFIASMVPAAWMLETGPPPRALHVSGFFFIVMLLALAATARVMRPNVVRVAPILMVLSIAIAGYAAYAVTKTFDEGRRGAAEMDRIDATMRANRGRDVVIHSPWSIAERVLVTDPTFWTNRCICDFYGVRSLRITR